MQAATENRCKGVRVGTPAGCRGAGGEGEHPDTFPEQLSDGAGTQWLSRCALEPTQAPPVCRESSLMGKPPVIPLQGEKKKKCFPSASPSKANKPTTQQVSFDQISPSE